MEQNEVVSKAFEFSFTTGVLTIIIIGLVWIAYKMIKLLYDDNKELTKDLMDVSRSTLATFDKVADMKDLSKESLAEIKKLRIEIIDKQCRWVSTG